MNNLKINKNFTLNGESFTSVDTLLDYSESLSKSTKQFLQDWFSKSEFIQVKTSGSTGKPKLIQLRKQFMINSALSTGAFFKLFENTTALLCMSTEYIAGKMMLVRALVLGWKLDVIMPKSTPLENINKYYDFSAMVPIQLQNSLNELHKIKKLIIGGGVISQHLENQIKDVSTEIFSTFGMTETITHIALKKLNNFETFKKSQDSYKALPGIFLSQDDRKCLVIHADKISNQTTVTNDVVELISSVEFKWLGRYDNVINSGGIKLHSEVIEKKLVKIISQRFFVTGIPDEILGEKLILIVEGAPMAIDLSKAKNLTRYEIPRQIYFIDSFIETPTKKIQRNKTLDLISL